MTKQLIAAMGFPGVRSIDRTALPGSEHIGREVTTVAGPARLHLGRERRSTPEHTAAAVPFSPVPPMLRPGRKQVRLGSYDPVAVSHLW